MPSMSRVSIHEIGLNVKCCFSFTRSFVPRSVHAVSNVGSICLCGWSTTVLEKSKGRAVVGALNSVYDYEIRLFFQTSPQTIHPSFPDHQCWGRVFQSSLSVSRSISDWVHIVIVLGYIVSPWIPFRLVMNSEWFDSDTVCLCCMIDKGGSECGGVGNWSFSFIGRGVDPGLCCIRTDSDRFNVSFSEGWKGGWLCVWFKCALEEY